MSSEGKMDSEQRMEELKRENEKLRAEIADYQKLLSDREARLFKLAPYEEKMNRKGTKADFGKQKAFVKKVLMKLHLRKG